MATSLLLLLDDIASVLDDVATMTKVAAKKTAGVLGDDLALNAKQVTGVHPQRELPVVWAVARGSAINKAILIPAALLISWLAPWAIPLLLVAGGSFLCFEGTEKLLHRLLHSKGEDEAHHAEHAAALTDPAGDPVAVEKARIRGAVRTDFILSAEIIVITLGVVAGKSLATQLGVLAAVGVAMTVGVYGLVAAIVKLDDLGAMLATADSALARGLGRAIVVSAPWLMRGLSVAGTAAMFLVGGGIVSHELPPVHHAMEALHHNVESALGPGAGVQVGMLLAEAALGLAVGLLVVAIVELGKRILPQRPRTA